MRDHRRSNHLLVLILLVLVVWGYLGHLQREAQVILVRLRGYLAALVTAATALSLARLVAKR